jgi:hypothetical protein
MSTTEKNALCGEVEEALSQILDGTASARLFDHVADCDACRDMRHEATLAAERVRDAGADFRPADDFADRLLERLEAARPGAPASAASAPRSSDRKAERSDRKAESVVVHGGATEPGAETAATVFDPLAAAKAESGGDNATTFDPLAAAKAEAAETESGRGARSDITQPSAREPAGKTREEAPAPEALRSSSTSPVASGVSATTHHGPITEPGPVEDHDPPAEAEPAPAPEKSAQARPGKTIEQAPALDLVKKPAARPAKVSFLRRPAFLAGAAGAVAAAAMVGFYLRGSGSTSTTTITKAPWSGSVASVARASADKTGGFEACNLKGACSPVEGGAEIKAGWTLRTDSRTRAHVTLADQTDLALDRGTEVELTAGQDRAARLKRGTIVADVAKVEGSAARFAFGRGEVEVLGTKLAITATDDRASIEVARGSVRVRSDSGKTVDVRAGEEATLVGNADPVVGSTTSLADVMEWSDSKPEDVDAPVLRGLGELRARKPGQTKEKDHAVRLSRHAVKARIVDVVARTEVDETFSNDTDEELEGIYRFPLPPGAQIERLALEVDGKLIDGAFVDRDKGAAIWRGVIQNAAPKAPKPREEIIWVPGPWRDPALLEWQRGGRFELKIFPIPRKGSRRVVLTYTQTVEQSAGLRRFTYPLAHDPSGTTKVGSFDLDVQVLGADKSVGLSTRGYELASAAGEGDRRTMHADNFVPAGDLTVEYALPDRDKDVTAWAYAMSPGASPPSTSTGASPAKAKSAEEKAAAETANAILDDKSPYVAIAVRPRLPRWQEAKERLHVIVVDSSRSMIGERFARATHLASSIVREMDRRDSFMVLACDTVCRPMSGEGGGSPKAEAPGAVAAGEVERFLGSIEPDGGSDLAASMTAARAAAGSLGSKELRIIYLGDGTPSVGPTRPAHLEAAVRSAVATGDNAVVAVALGADADTISLGALARGGGGVVVPYVPGQKVSSAALEVLSAAYGVVLRDPEVELPSGLSQVTPARLDPIRAGGETLIVARMNGGSEISGNVKLKGRVAGEKFEQSYPLKVLSTTSAGNAFVPRLYAAAKIAELERTGGEAQKTTVIELSKRFAVASRFTSLLVLESEAMFKAFGLDRTSSAPSFTGEQQAESSTGEAEGDKPKEEASAARDEFSPRAAATSSPASGAPGGGGGLAGHGHSAKPAREAAGPMAPPAEADDRASAPAPKKKALDMESPWSSAPAPAAPRPQSKVRGFDDGWSPPPPPRRQRFVPMRKVFDRKVSFDAVNTFVSQNAAKLTVAESSLAAAPDSRDKTVELYSLYATTGRLGEAQELTAKWAGRDALDPDALIARADLAARQGDRDRAVRILGGLADVRPNDRAVQTRLADMQDAAGNAALACEHRIALADMALSDAKLVAAAIGCARTQGLVDLASVLRFDTTDKVREAVDKLLAAPATISPTARGDVQISAEWAGGGDIDLALVDAQGKRTSWLGSPGKGTVSARDVKSSQRESLDVAGLGQGSYVVEVARTSSADASTPIRGEVTLRLAGETRKVAFNLTGARAEVGTVRVFFTSHLEPVGGFGGGWR